MFTGIIQGIAIIINIEYDNELKRYILDMPDNIIKCMNLGESISHNGCCITVVKIKNNSFEFELMKETLKITNLNNIKLGDMLNIEISINIGEKICGHLISGHIIYTAKIIEIIQTYNNCYIYFQIHKKNLKYIFEKGYIGIDGVSLTIVNVYKNIFCVNLVSETLSRTILNYCNIGYIVNIEVDYQTKLIVDTIFSLKIYE